jgi:hypothetical protein
VRGGGSARRLFVPPLETSNSNLSARTVKEIKYLKEEKREEGKGKRNRRKKRTGAKDSET